MSSLIRPRSALRESRAKYSANRTNSEGSGRGNRYLLVEFWTLEETNLQGVVVRGHYHSRLGTGHCDHSSSGDTSLRIAVGTKVAFIYGERVL